MPRRARACSQHEVLGPAVLSLRPVFKHFNVIALDVLVRAVGHRTDNYLPTHTIVTIDPEKNDLQDILDIFTPTTESGRELASIITEFYVVIKPVGKYKGLVEYLRKCHDAGQPPLLFPELGQASEQSLREYEEVQKRQLVSDLVMESAEGEQRLRMMLAAMSRLSYCSIMTDDLRISGLPRFLGTATNKTDLISSNFSLHFLDCSSHTIRDSLYLCVSQSSMMAESQSPARSLEPGYKMLTSFLLEISDSSSTSDIHFNKVDFYASSQRVHDCLATMHKLKRLSLRCEIHDVACGWHNHDFDDVGSSDWLHDVLRDQTWPDPQDLWLSGWILSSADLMETLTQHCKSLVDVDLSICVLDTHDHTLQLIKHMRDDLTLSSCLLNIGAMEKHRMRGELRELADAYCPYPQRRRSTLVPDHVYWDEEDAEADYDTKKYNLGHYVLKHDPPA